MIAFQLQQRLCSRDRHHPGHIWTGVLPGRHVTLRCPGIEKSTLAARFRALLNVLRGATP